MYHRAFQEICGHLYSQLCKYQKTSCISSRRCDGPSPCPTFSPLARLLNLTRAVRKKLQFPKKNSSSLLNCPQLNWCVFLTFNSRFIYMPTCKYERHSRVICYFLLPVKCVHTRVWHPGHHHQQSFEKVLE